MTDQLQIVDLTSTAREYGKCPCGGSYSAAAVEVHMTIGGKPVALSDVPQGRCPSCGARVYKAAILESIEALFKRSDRAAGGS